MVHFCIYLQLYLYLYLTQNIQPPLNTLLHCFSASSFLLLQLSPTYFLYHDTLISHPRKLTNHLSHLFPHLQTQTQTQTHPHLPPPPPLVQVMKVPTHNCGQYSTCRECGQSKNPYCGWCSLRRR